MLSVECRTLTKAGGLKFLLAVVARLRNQSSEKDISEVPRLGICIAIPAVALNAECCTNLLEGRANSAELIERSEVAVQWGPYLLNN